MENKIRLIDANALMKYTLNTISRSIDCNDIARFPTIDPESLRPKGKWKLNRDGSGTCSECHRTRNDVWDMDDWDNFCSHCGADMR